MVGKVSNKDCCVASWKALLDASSVGKGEYPKEPQANPLAKGKALRAISLSQDRHPFDGNPRNALVAVNHRPPKQKRW